MKSLVIATLLATTVLSATTAVAETQKPPTDSYYSGPVWKSWDAMQHGNELIRLGVNKSSPLSIATLANCFVSEPAKVQILMSTFSMFHPSQTQFVVLEGPQAGCQGWMDHDRMEERPRQTAPVEPAAPAEPAKIKFWEGEGNKINSIKAPTCDERHNCLFYAHDNVPACESPDWTFAADNMRIDPSLRAGPYSHEAYELIDRSNGACNWIKPGSAWKIVQTGKYQGRFANHSMYCVVPQEGVTNGYCRWTMVFPVTHPLPTPYPF